MKDSKIFVYLRFRDDKDILLKSKTREFAAVGKLLGDFMAEVLRAFGLHVYKTGYLEYVDANTEIILVSFRKDPIHQQFIVSGLIPEEYRERMLDREAVKIPFSAQEFTEKISTDLDNVQKAIVRQKMQRPFPDILSLIGENINSHGEFYLVLPAN